MDCAGDKLGDGDCDRGQGRVGQFREGCQERLDSARDGGCDRGRDRERLDSASDKLGDGRCGLPYGSGGRGSAAHGPGR